MLAVIIIIIIIIQMAVFPTSKGIFLEEEMVIHSGILVWKIYTDREAWRATVHGVTRESDTTE